MFNLNDVIKEYKNKLNMLQKKKKLKNYSFIYFKLHICIIKTYFKHILKKHELIDQLVKNNDQTVNVLAVFKETGKYNKINI